MYQALLALRQQLPALQDRRRARFAGAPIDQDAIVLRYYIDGGANDVLVVVNLKGDLQVALAAQEITRPPVGRRWRVILSTDEARFGGPQALEEVQRMVDAGHLAASSSLTLVLQSN